MKRTRTCTIYIHTYILVAFGNACTRAWQEAADAYMQAELDREEKKARVYIYMYTYICICIYISRGA